MEKQSFQNIIRELKSLTPRQHKDLKDLVSLLDEKKKVSILLEAEVEVSCGHCGSDNYVKNGRCSDLQRFKCKKCGKSFNILTGTPLARLRKKGRWYDYALCLKKGYSVRKSAGLTGVSKNTSFKWRHLFLQNSNFLKANKLNGVVEVKETSFKYSEKGSKIIRNPGMFGKDIYVLTSLDRNRMTSTPKIVDLNCESIEKYNKSLYAIDGIFVSKKYKELVDFTHIKGLNHKKSIRSLGGKYYRHIDNAVAYNNNLHEWMTRFKGVATKYLENYLSWFRELDEHLMDIPAKVLLVRAFSLTRYPYQPKIKE